MYPRRTEDGERMCALCQEGVCDPETEFCSTHDEQFGKSPEWRRGKSDLDPRFQTAKADFVRRIQLEKLNHTGEINV